MLALVAALYAGFKGRAQWEPHDQDIPQGSQHVGALAACAFIVIITYFFGTPQSARAISIVTAVALVVTVASYFIYQALTTSHIYTMETVVDGVSKRINILGGAELSVEATKKHKAGQTIQDLIDHSGGNLEACLE